MRVRYGQAAVLDDPHTIPCFALAGQVAAAVFLEIEDVDAAVVYEADMPLAQHPLGGVSLVPVLTGAKKSVRDTAVSYWSNATTVRTSTHRFICKTVKEKKKDFALYDMRSEPDPVENLAKKKPELVQELLKKLSR